MPANATIYLPVEDVDLGKIFESAKSKKTFFKRERYFEVDVAGDLVRFNVMPTEQLGSHLNGFVGYISSLHDDDHRKQEATSFVRQSRIVLGLVTKKEFYENEALISCLFEIAEAYGGIVFTQNSVIKFDGNVLVGPLYGNT
ncbi:hypothetical protein [Noviherbaspirillum massiliense]|uniref:hypothetical protein n=1 Tax=Noviherbaspirillum massiliense TaxID=1465823 RepID=UPI00035D249F|nr:hypothetical protein [Noviherbaspirillum massiliense]